MPCQASEHIKGKDQEVQAESLSREAPSRARSHSHTVRGIKSLLARPNCDVTIDLESSTIFSASLQSFTCHELHPGLSLSLCSDEDNAGELERCVFIAHLNIIYRYYQF